LTVNDAVTFQNTGVLTLGSAAYTFTNGVTALEPTISIAGNARFQAQGGSNLDFDAITIEDGFTLTLGGLVAAANDITYNTIDGVTAGAANLTINTLGTVSGGNVGDVVTPLGAVVVDAGEFVMTGTTMYAGSVDITTSGDITGTGTSIVTTGP